MKGSKLKKRMILSVMLVAGLSATTLVAANADSGAKAIATKLSKELTKIYQTNIKKSDSSANAKKGEAEILKASKKYSGVKTVKGYADFYQVADSTKVTYCVYPDIVPFMKKSMEISLATNTTKAEITSKITALSKKLNFIYSVGDCKKLGAKINQEVQDIVYAAIGQGFVGALGDSSNGGSATPSDQDTVQNIASTLANGLVTGTVTIVQPTATTDGSITTDSGTVTIPVGTFVTAQMGTDIIPGSFCVSKGGYMASDTSGGVVSGSCPKPLQS
jgi:hypothetical protein